MGGSEIRMTNPGTAKRQCSNVIGPACPGADPRQLGDMRVRTPPLDRKFCKNYTYIEQSQLADVEMHISSVEFSFVMTTDFYHIYNSQIMFGDTKIRNVQIILLH